MRALVVTTLMASTAIGCSATVEDPASDDETGVVHGAVVVERTVAADGRAASQARVSARFMRLEGIDVPIAERVVATRRFQPGEPVGCRWLATDEEALPPSAEGSIELVDVGDIVVHTVDGGRDTPLVTRAFPDVGDLVSGVVYTSRDDSWLPEAEGYLIEVAGSDEVDAFSLRLESPGVPSAVSFDGIGLAELDVVRVGETVELRWAPGGANDEVYVDLVPVDVNDGAPYRCVLVDDGLANFVTPGFEPGVELDVEVHRYRRLDVERARAAGIDLDDAVLEVDVAAAARVTVAE
jgi:hypothetical protein